MSEIYNGSFVLGNTSATTLSAGPGIKIDDSQPGVIKVSNDETVLWSGTYTTGAAIQTNESMENFEWIRFELESNDNYYRPQVFAPSTISAQHEIAFMDTNQNSTDCWYKHVKYSIKPSSVSAMDWRQWKCSNNTLSNSQVMQFTLHKIVGINRISGGN